MKRKYKKQKQKQKSNKIKKRYILKHNKDVKTRHTR